MTRLYRVVLRGFVAGAVFESDGTLTNCAPILSRFKGQPYRNLRDWVKKNGGSIEWVQ
jgi:hypothetical protein